MGNTEMVAQETKNEIVTEGVFSNIHNFKELYDIGYRDGAECFEGLMKYLNR